MMQKKWVTMIILDNIKFILLWFLKTNIVIVVHNVTMLAQAWKYNLICCGWKTFSEISTSVFYGKCIIHRMSTI